MSIFKIIILLLSWFL